MSVTEKYPLTSEAWERVAKALAETVNGGSWEEHYTKEQRKLWRMRAFGIAPLE
jgi:hypothetical protein